MSFRDLLLYPITVAVWNSSVGVQLIPNTHYTTNWIDQTVSIIAGASNGDTIVITVYALGGGNQQYTNSYNGTDVGNTLIIPVEYSLINEIVVFVNGQSVTNFTSAQSGTYDTRISFGSTYGATDLVTVTAMGFQTPQYSWSAPQTQYFVADGGLAFTLTNSLQGTNPANVIVEKNGVRARPAASVEYIDDGSSIQYYCPVHVDYSPALVANNDVSVYINTVPQILGVDFVLDPWNGVSEARTVTLSSMPAAGAKILISVRTAAQYYLSSNVLVWNSSGSLIPGPGDIISVTTWNDTAEQDILTQVFVGPISEGITVAEGYDSTVFDEAAVSNTSGSFDFSTGVQVLTNKFDTGRIISDPSRLEVTLDGFYLFNGNGYTVDGTSIIITGPAINASQVVVITSVTQSVVPTAIAFRIFQDMRGLQSTYRITNSTTTVLSQLLSQIGDIIYVEDAAALSEPNLPQGIFGLITIDGERIAYRYRDLDNNTVSGLRRGTAGTAAAEHTLGAAVYDIGLGNLLPTEYQNYIVSDEFLSDGLTTIYTAPDISVIGLDSTELTDAVQVYVGGLLQFGGYEILTADPVSIEFAVAPTINYQVTILVLRGESWYAPGAGTASDGIPLQEQETLAARFIRGN